MYARENPNFILSKQNFLLLIIAALFRTSSKICQPCYFKSLHLSIVKVLDSHLRFQVVIIGFMAAFIADKEQVELDCLPWRLVSICRCEPFSVIKLSFSLDGFALKCINSDRYTKISSTCLQFTSIGLNLSQVALGALDMVPRNRAKHLNVEQWRHDAK